MQIEVHEAADGVSTEDAAGRDQILVSTIREDASLPGSFWVWMVSDNLRRGSALNAVLAAETVKRVVRIPLGSDAREDALRRLEGLTELKTAWHPIGA